MATKKVIEVNGSSIVDLRAELFRKEQLFRKEPEKTAPLSKPNTQKKPPVWSKQKKARGVAVDVPSSQPDDLSEHEKALQKSRKMLQAKAALYDKMAKGDIEDEGDDESGEGSRFLVDFQKKVYSKEEQQRSDEEDLINEPIPPPSCPQEEWVEYVDSLGRSRKCLRKDLQELQRKDRELCPRKSPSPPTLLSDDMRRQLMRQKWEKEELEAMDRPVGPVHYQNIHFDEVRAHGVGYYQFSKDEAERQKQMETLNKLRGETTNQRTRIEKIKEKRKAALEARLAKVRARKNIKPGQDPTETSPNVATSVTGPTEENEKNSLEAEVLQRETGESRETRSSASPEKDMSEGRVAVTKAELPEWARHKIQQVDRRRQLTQKDEREPDFAPPSFYYDNTGPKQPKAKRQRHNKTTEESTQGAPQGGNTDDLGDYTTEDAQQSDQPMHGQQNWPPYPPYPPPPQGTFVPQFPPPPFAPPPSQGNLSFQSFNIPTHLPPPPQEHSNYYPPPPQAPNVPPMPPPGMPYHWPPPPWQPLHQHFMQSWQPQNLANQSPRLDVTSQSDSLSENLNKSESGTSGCQKRSVNENTEEATEEKGPNGTSKSLEGLQRTAPSVEALAEFVGSFRH